MPCSRKLSCNNRDWTPSPLPWLLDTGTSWGIDKPISPKSTCMFNKSFTVSSCNRRVKSSTSWFGKDSHIVCTFVTLAVTLVGCFHKAKHLQNTNLWRKCECSGWLHALTCHKHKKDAKPTRDALILTAVTSSAWQCQTHRHINTQARLRRIRSTDLRNAGAQRHGSGNRDSGGARILQTILK